MPLNPDFRDILLAFENEQVEFLIVGAYALSAHGINRYTGDIDLWVHPTSENAARVWQALIRFKAPMSKITPEDFRNPDNVYQMGLPPCRIDVLTSISGVDFESAFANRQILPIDDLRMPFLSLDDMLVNKRESGRDKDLVDVRLIERKLGKNENEPLQSDD